MQGYLYTCKTADLSRLHRSTHLLFTGTIHISPNVNKNDNTPLSCCRQIKNRQNLPMSNLKPDLYNINAYIKFCENPLRFTQGIVLKLKYRCVAGRYLTNRQNLPKADLHNINAYTKFGENPLAFINVSICK